VFINGIPAARVSDKGVHAACCGPNMFEIKMGSSTVYFDGLQAARKGDMTQHCSAFPGEIKVGSPNVDIGD
jgi:uncharacterized Zn-binding protein involved in type VI secretion